MIYNPGVREDFAVPLPITENARRTAEDFASQQATPAKAEQVRLNTLAVCVVNDYLQMMGMTTDIEASDSWNQLLRLFANVADLELPGVGRLECRPIQAQTPSCTIPPEVWDLRVGYVVVEIDDQLEEAKLLGFVPSARVEELPLNQLQSPENFLDYVYTLRLKSDIQPAPSSIQVNLTQWLAGVFASGWQTVESLLNPPQLSPDFAFRSWDTRTTLDVSEFASRSEDALTTPDTTTPVRRAKLISWGVELNESPLVLVVEVTPVNAPSAVGGNEPPIRILLQLYSVNQTHLPTGVQLTVLDETGQQILQAISRNLDQYLQLQMGGTPGEAFTVQVSFGDASAVEEFVI
jgi:hypothetical protein